MTDDPPPRVRANALSAAVFVPLRDVDPRVVEPLLDSLEDAGVAAYAEPRPTGASIADYVEPRAPRKPTLEERLWVDGSRRAIAEEVVAAELPGLLAELGRPDPDDVFAAIVANWDLPVSEQVTPWPVREEVELEPLPPPEREPEVWRSSASDLLPALEGEHDPPVADEEHYVPPPPPPIPPAQMATKFAIAGIVIGVVCLLGLQRLLGFPTGRNAYLFGTLLVVGGLATLFARLRDTSPVDDDPDEGAQV